jgi:hypothetical protein
MEVIGQFYLPAALRLRKDPLPNQPTRLFIECEAEQVSRVRLDVLKKGKIISFSFVYIFRVIVIPNNLQ